VIDKVNAMATSQLWLLDETVCKVFHPKQRLKDEYVKIMSFGELKMVFLGDAVQMTLVCGAPIYNITVTRIETNSGCHNSSEYKCKTARGLVLYSNYLSKNCISLTKSYRNQGLLLEIMDHVQNAFQTLSGLDKLLYQQRKYPNMQTAREIHYSNKSRSIYNSLDL